MPRKIFFSVGEPSGDLHAAGLLRQLQQLDPTIETRGFGGAKMVQAGFSQDFDLTQLAVVGFLEVLPKLREFFRLKDQAKATFRSEVFDAVVLVDMPGFNWHIAAEARKAGIPVFYYMPPQLWAWGAWRIHKMKRSVNHVLCALPMEKAFFESHGMDAQLVGHPFFEHVSSHPLDQDWIRKQRSESSWRVAVLPGSRRRELQAIWPLQLEAIGELHRRFPNYHFDVACLNETHADICRSIYERAPQTGLPLRFHVGKTSEAIHASTCVLMKSGSVSLELLARGKPASVLYHASHSTYRLGKALSSVKFISLPNIIADQEVIPEYIAVGSSKKVIRPLIESMSQLMESEEVRQRQINQLSQIREMCGGSHASQNAAELIADRLGWYTTTAKKLWAA